MVDLPRGRDIFIVGTGRAGLVMARALMRTPHRILGTWNRSADASARVRVATGAPAFHGRIPQVARSAQLLLLAVRDDALRDMDGRLGSESIAGPGMVVAHMAGALGSAVLEQARCAGASVGSIHPVASFSEDSVLPVGTHFAVEGDAAALALLRQLAQDLGGTPVTVDAGQKPRYHAALVFASNYLVALSSIALELLSQAGMGEDAARGMLGPLLEGTARNIRREGATEALTGPVTRGDVETVRAHLEALKSSADLHALYQALGLRALELARRQGLEAPLGDALHKVLTLP